MGQVIEFLYSIWRLGRAEQVVNTGDRGAISRRCIFGCCARARAHGCGNLPKPPVGHPPRASEVHSSLIAVCGCVCV